jgi:4-amino-4-deoxy-L-arabinose transferase-like glycosyltransferase
MLVVLVLVIGTTLRFVLAATIGLGVDESYAVVVARKLSLSYFDHPPLSFWMASMAARLGGSESALVVRLPFILLFAGTTWILYRLAARLFGAWAGAYAALLLSLAPLFSVSTGGWVLPDGPLEFFLALSAYCLCRVLLEDSRTPLRWWLAAGIAAGLALLSKYQAALLIPGALVFLVTRRASRRWLRTPGPWLAALAAAALFSPVLLWNAQHQWASFRFQLARGASEGGIHLLPLLQNVAGQAGYLFPWIWLPLVVVLVQGFARGPRDAPRWFCTCLAIWPIALFTLVALGGKPGLPHWPAPGYLMLLPPLGAAVAWRMERGDVRVRRWLWGCILAFGVVLAVAATQTATGWMTRLMPALFRRGDPTLEAFDWTGLRPALAKRGLLARHGQFIGTVSWIEAGKVAYALGPDERVASVCSQPHQFGYLAPAQTLLGRDALLLDRTRGPSDVPRRYAPYFASIDSLPPVVLERAGDPVLLIAVFRARDYRIPYPAEISP